MPEYLTSAMSTTFDLNPSENSPQLQTPAYKVPPVTVILTIVLFVLFLGIVFSIKIRCYFMRDLFNSSNHRRLPSNSATNGLDPSIIDTFPTLVYSSVKDLRESKRGLECAICLVEFQDNDEIRLLTVCNHVFHRNCIDEWFGNHTTCPLCRKSLLPPEISPPEIGQQERETREEIEEVVVVVGGGDLDSHEGATSGANATEDRGQDKGKVVVERLSRYNTTGHSIMCVKQELHDDRYTLRLPDHLMEQIVRGYKWTASCNTFGENSNNSGGTRKGRLAEKWKSL
ncbi:hypothetical protein NE237_025533 [Protea cynaroides]|uniref:RING-type E3 ubiquitin transferase n=1 Tax=Protea cynaroides TaxID=273540 RepID=A0A9Q0H6F2_9MAGN|nr:hypothetical protein NE237_025533 [Protea cynaroides]